MLRLSLLLVLLWAQPALGGGYYIVTGEFSDAQGAQAMLSQLPADRGTARVSRQLLHGVGWRYLVRVDGFGSADDAQKTARSLPVSGPIRIYTGEGTQREVVAVVVSSNPPAQAPVAERAPEPVAKPAPAAVAKPAPAAVAKPAPAAVAKPAPAPVAKPAPEPVVEPEAQPVPTPLPTVSASGKLPNASTILAHSVRAHGGKAGGQALVDGASKVHLAYRLETRDGGKEQVVAHVYIREGKSAYLSTSVVRGNFSPNLIVIRKGKDAWLATRGRVQGQSVADARRKVEMFSPSTGPFKIALGLPGAIETTAAWRGLATRAVVKHQGRDHYRLTPTGSERGHPMVSALIDAQSFLVSQFVLVAGGKEMVIGFEKYRQIQEGVILPFRIRTESGGKLTKDIYLQTLDLDPSTDPALFEKPASLPKK